MVSAGADMRTLRDGLLISSYFKIKVFKILDLQNSASLVDINKSVCLTPVFLKLYI